MKNFLWSAGSVIVTLAIVLILSGTGAVKFGTISSPSTNLDYLVLSQALGFGNTGSDPKVNITASRQNLTTNSTIPCAIQNPLNATSSLIAFSLNVATGPGGSTALVVGTTTSATATSSDMVSQTIGTGALATITWDPPINAAVIAPGGWVTAGTNGTGATTLTGSCAATFESDV